MTNKQALIIFIKNPEKGKVKTRLAKTVGDEKALLIYKALLGHTRQIASSILAKRLLFYSQYIPLNDEWPAEHFVKLLQASGNLGHKMKEAFRTAFQTQQKIVIIGSDCASLSPEIVSIAFDQLEKYPFVIGPAVDGGYYLLGMNQFYPSVFDDITWSTPSVFQQTVAHFKALKQPYYCLPTLSDIDYEEDWNKYGWKV